MSRLTISGMTVNWSSEIKFLGVIFASNLKFTKHIEYLKRKAFKRMNILKGVVCRSRGVRSIHIICMVNALIRSLFYYASFLLDDVSNTDKKAIEVVYNAGLRIASGLPKWTPIPILRADLNQKLMTKDKRS